MKDMNDDYAMYMHNRRDTPQVDSVATLFPKCRTWIVCRVTRKHKLHQILIVFIFTSPSHTTTLNLHDIITVITNNNDNNKD
mmetsp:Transcript_2260/g.5284  ORF Transcript_2260/g.5284 Transcript_2260/m.5284 type:complete len:82 (-) Transcript_2260:27-272(-)